MKIVSFDEAIAVAWDDLVASSPDGFVYATTAWRKVILGVKEWGLEDHSFAVSESGMLLGVMPLQYAPAAKHLSSSGWGASGPVLAKSLNKKQRKIVSWRIFEYVAEVAAQLRVKQFSFAVPAVNTTSINAPWGVNPWLEFGFKDTSGTTRIVDLKENETRIYNDLSMLAKRMIKKAKNAGLYVERGDWQHELERYYDAHVETYTRTGVSPHPKAYFSGIANTVAPMGLSMLWVCRDKNGNAIAYHNSTISNGGAIYCTGCSHKSALENGANYLLFYEAILKAKDYGATYYECGDVFFDASKKDEFGSLKTYGLTVFKTKFGGENHHTFRCVKHFYPDQHTTQPLSKKELLKDFLRSGKKLTVAFFGEKITGTLSAILWFPWHCFRKMLLIGTSSKKEKIATDDILKVHRGLYVNSKTYPVTTITGTIPEEDEPEYARRQLKDKFDLVRKYAREGALVDLCCGNGTHLACLTKHNGLRLGLDYSPEYVVHAQKTFGSTKTAIAFIRSDATRLPLADKSIATLYCFSSLYLLPSQERLISAVHRALMPGGIAIFDFGNKYSLNTICTRYYPEIADITSPSISKGLAQCQQTGFDILEHRSYQLLPLWADRPRWLWPLLHPKWNTLMMKRINGKMLDEWISSLPVLRRFAFRHLIVCRKPKEH